MDTLSKGSKGDDVKRLQEKLGLKADGGFGAGTEAALIQWQKANGISPANGVAGKDTLQKMGLLTAAAPVAGANAGASAGTPPATSSGAASKLNLKALKGVIPDNIIDQIVGAADKFAINSNLRLAHFLAQCAQESGEFKAVSENLNYSANRLRQIFPKYFPTDAIANDYANDPEKIGNRVYGGRLGNGPEATGEGYKYKGRGFIQLTGKDNYTNFTKFIGEDCVKSPELVASKYALASAAHFFNNLAKLWPICDKGADEATITTVSKRVNGGTHGLEGRKAYFKKYWALLSKPS